MPMLLLVMILTYSVFNSFHPTLPLLATTSGQRYTFEPNDDENDEKLFVSKKKHENSLNLWWLSQMQPYAQATNT